MRWPEPPDGGLQIAKWFALVPAFCSRFCFLYCDQAKAVFKTRGAFLGDAHGEIIFKKGFRKCHLASQEGWSNQEFLSVVFDDFFPSGSEYWAEAP